MRGSRPTTARGRWPAKAPEAASTCAAAAERSRASSAVTSRFARPRTPSVPKSRAIDVLPDFSHGRAPDGTTQRRPRWSEPPRPSLSAIARSALGILRSLAGLLEAGLLALDNASVPSQEPGLLERCAVGLGVDPVERPGDAEAQCSGLTRRAATGDARDDVETTLDVHELERAVDELLVHLVRKVVLERAPVDLPRPGAWDQPNPRHCLLAAAERGAGSSDALPASGRNGRFGGERAGRVVARKVDVDRGLCHCGPRVHGDVVPSEADAYWATWVISNGCGCCAACGCSAPAYTLSLLIWVFDREFFDSMPRTAFSTARSGRVARRSPYDTARRPPG